MKKFYPLIIALLTLTACSTTRNIPEDDHLFVGLTKIAYDNPDEKHHRQNLEVTKEEVEAALATAPNGALFGSSYYRTPFPYGLWIWNRFSDKEGKFAEWMTSSFGKQPVLIERRGIRASRIRSQRDAKRKARRSQARPCHASPKRTNATKAHRLPETHLRKRA